MQGWSSLPAEMLEFLYPWRGRAEQEKGVETDGASSELWQLTNTNTWPPTMCQAWRRQRCIDTVPTLKGSQTGTGKADACGRCCRGSRSDAITQRRLFYAGRDQQRGLHRWADKTFWDLNLKVGKHAPNIRHRRSKGVKVWNGTVFRATLSSTAFLEYEGEMDVGQTQEEGPVMRLNRKMNLKCRMRKWERSNMRKVFIKRIFLHILK